VKVRLSIYQVPSDPFKLPERVVSHENANGLLEMTGQRAAQRWLWGLKKQECRLPYCGKTGTSRTSVAGVYVKNTSIFFAVLRPFRSPNSGGGADAMSPVGFISAGDTAAPNFFLR